VFQTEAIAVGDSYRLAGSNQKEEVEVTRMFGDAAGGVDGKGKPVYQPEKIQSTCTRLVFHYLRGLSVRQELLNCRFCGAPADDKSHTTEGGLVPECWKGLELGEAGTESILSWTALYYDMDTIMLVSRSGQSLQLSRSAIFTPQLMNILYPVSVEGACPAQGAYSSSAPFKPFSRQGWGGGLPYQKRFPDQQGSDVPNHGITSQSRFPAHQQKQDVSGHGSASQKRAHDQGHQQPPPSNEPLNVPVKTKVVKVAKVQPVQKRKKKKAVAKVPQPPPIQEIPAPSPPLIPLPIDHSSDEEKSEDSSVELLSEDDDQSAEEAEGKDDE
jgi:hypothetical protein